MRRGHDTSYWVETCVQEFVKFSPGFLDPVFACKTKVPCTCGKHADYIPWFEYFCAEEREGDIGPITTFGLPDRNPSSL